MPATSTPSFTNCSEVKNLVINLSRLFKLPSLSRSRGKGTTNKDKWIRLSLLLEKFPFDIPTMGGDLSFTT